LDHKTSTYLSVQKHLFIEASGTQPQIVKPDVSADGSEVAGAVCMLSFSLQSKIQTNADSAKMEVL